MRAAGDGAVRRTIDVPLAIGEAFDLFTIGMIQWWPHEYTFSEDSLEAIAFEPVSGGRWYERDGDGREITWGTVRAWSAPERLVVTWQVTPRRTPEPDPARGSEVEVAFTPGSSSSTRVDLEHRAFDRQGEEGEQMRAGMDSDEGWTKILDCYRSEALRKA